MKHLALSLLLLSFCLASCSGLNPKEKSNADLTKELYYDEGTRYLMEKNYTEALAKLIEAEKIAPSDSRVQNNLGMAYFFKNRPELAIEHINKSIALDPLNIDAKLNLGGIYFDKGRYEEALQIFLKVKENLTYPSQFRNYYNLGLTLTKLGKDAEAKENFLLSLNEKEDYCPSHFRLGQIFKKEGNLDKALEHFEEASKGVCYNEPSPFYEQALILASMGRTKLAKERLIDIITRFKNDPTAIKSQIKLQALDQALTKNVEGNTPSSDTYSNKAGHTPDF